MVENRCGRMSTTIQKDYYRNGQLREEVPLRRGRRHGIVRTWHKNGVLASEEAFEDGLLHGVCRQWDENGNLLGRFTMKRGTGVQRVWHDNGRLQMEMSTVNGEFCGRNRLWLSDGTPLSDRVCLHNRQVSIAAYRKAAAKDPTLPRLPGRITLARVKPAQTKILRVLTDWLLQKPNGFEARAWLTKIAGKRSGRALGRFKSERQAARFVERLYGAGAVEVIAPDTYINRKGDQFADCLVVRLPKGAPRRKAIRAVCALLNKRKLGAVEPDKDVGETHLFLSLF
jgi:MORN repeat variant